MLKVISNTTPVIALADIGQLDLLRKLYGKIIIPTAVMEEIQSEPARSLVLKSKDWIEVLPVSDKSNKSMYRARLHAGEVEVMILAQELNADLVLLDDNTAKKTAAYLGLHVAGTLGVLLFAKESGLIPKIAPVLSDLENDGFFMSNTIKSLILKKAGEE